MPQPRIVRDVVADWKNRVTVHGPGARVTFTDGVDRAFELARSPAAPHDDDDTIALTVRHPIALAEHVFVPHLTPEEGNVAGDWVFRSPAVIVAGEGRALAFIPDIDDVERVLASGARAWLDYDHGARAITLAIGAYRHEGHVFFARKALAVRSNRDHDRIRLHVLSSDRNEDIVNPYGMAARFLWERWGKERLVAKPLSRYLEHVLHFTFAKDGWTDSVWQPVGAPVFIVDVGRHPSVPREKRTWREPRSVWNQAWFSTQRCANGLLRHARRAGSSELEQRATSMTEIALSAPQTDGLFPSVLLAEDDDSWRWTNSDRRPASASSEACHLVDAAFTSRMLLEWHALTGERRALDRVRLFADRLVREQRPSGAFPGWIEPDGAVPAELAEGPESAVAATLLFELGLRDAALRAIPFLEGVTRDGRWEDFETYYSCAHWGTPGTRVARNGVWKQNTLSIAWCAEAFLHAWRTTKDEALLRLARRCVDELSLYQAVWAPPFLPASAHGGFAVMNADAEWNDARQSLFSPLYLELGTVTHDRELVERGVSALRASFTMMYCPENAALARAYEKRFPFFGRESWGFMMENQGHDPATPIGTFTIFTWGPGSALAALATVRDRFPEIAREHGLE
jgi:hypothetical protein